MSNRPTADDFNAWFPDDPALFQSQPGQRIGVVVGGSLSKGLKVRLDMTIAVEVKLSDPAIAPVVPRGLGKRLSRQANHTGFVC